MERPSGAGHDPRRRVCLERRRIAPRRSAEQHKLRVVEFAGHGLTLALQEPADPGPSLTRAPDRSDRRGEGFARGAQLSWTATHTRTHALFRTESQSFLGARAIEKTSGTSERINRPQLTIAIRLAEDGETVTLSLPEPGAWTGMVTNIVRYRLKEISAGAFVEEAHVRSRLRRPTAPAGALSQATTALRTIDHDPVEAVRRPPPASSRRAERSGARAQSHSLPPMKDLGPKAAAKISWPAQKVGRRGVKNLAQSDGPQDHDRDRISAMRHGSRSRWKRAGESEANWISVLHTIK